MLGDTNTGKSCMLNRFVNHTFDASLIFTIGNDLKHKKFKIGSTELSIGLWDTCGQSEFDEVTRATLKGASAFVLVYDIGNKKSFETLKSRHLKWIQEDHPKNKKVILVGNKCDIQSDQREVSNDEGHAFARENGINLFLECSAKEGSNVDAVFHILGQNLIGYSHVEEKAAEKPSSKMKWPWSKKSQEIASPETASPEIPSQETAVVTVVNNHPDRNVLFIIFPQKEKDTIEECKNYTAHLNVNATGGGAGGGVGTAAKFIRNDVAATFWMLPPRGKWEYTPRDDHKYDYAILFQKGTDSPHHYYFPGRCSATPLTKKIVINESMYFDGLPEMKVEFRPNDIIDITNA